jgi:hypothetical protein
MNVRSSPYVSDVVHQLGKVVQAARTTSDLTGYTGHIVKVGR